MDEIEKAYKAHSSVGAALKSSPIILRKHPTHITHPINKHQVRGKALESDTAQHLLAMRLMSRKYLYLTGGMPPPDDVELNFREQWLHGTHHELLMSILQSGRVPLGWMEYWSPDSPPTTSNALTLATHLGYFVPDNFLTGKSSSYSESKAFHASYMMVSGNFGHWLPGTKFNNWQSFVCQLTGQFLVPDPIVKDKTPYVLDQLWIVANTNDQVRLIGLEIDGEVHLDAEKIRQDEKRDVMLAAMGYEIYHVAGWWCRIDPYRVICEFMSVSGIFPNAEKYIIGQKLHTIYDYICDICKKPMVRWDIDWIAEIVEDGNVLTVHRGCTQ